MTDPILVEVTRGPMIESVHRGAVAVFDADGKAVLEIGDCHRPIYPRSAIKIIQALPLVESGAAERFNLTQAQLALACASHGGETAHAQTAHAMLKAAGLEETALECGAHWPMHTSSAYALASEGRKPTALHNNCSGKHAGFLCLACHQGLEQKGYGERGSQVQRFIAEALERVTGETVNDDTPCGTDGCSIPTYALPMHKIAIGFAKLGAGAFDDPSLNKAAKTLREAVAAHPFMVAGTERFCTKAMDIFGQRAFVKTGAEGVFCGLFPEQGLGVALKCADGNSRGAEVMMAALIKRYVKMTDEEAQRLDALVNPVLSNWNKMEVGRLRPVGALA